MMVILDRHALYFIFILVCRFKLIKMRGESFRNKIKLIKGANKVVVVVVVVVVLGYFMYIINSRIYHYIILIDIPSMLGNTIRSFFKPVFQPNLQPRSQGFSLEGERGGKDLGTRLFYNHYE